MIDWPAVAFWFLWLIFTIVVMAFVIHLVVR
jgi:hypothetical protein